MKYVRTRKNHHDGPLRQDLQEVMGKITNNGDSMLLFDFIMEKVIQKNLQER